MAVDGGFMYTEYLELDEQRQHRPELHTGNVGISTEGGVIVILDDDLQVFHMSPGSEFSVEQPGLNISLACNLALDAAVVLEHSWRRIAPLLLTSKLLKLFSGNIVDQYGFFEPGVDAADQKPDLSCNTVNIFTAELPGFLDVLRDGGAAQNSAFVAFLHAAAMHY
ncbi:hypothetical protein H4S08_003698 [Coemansia sp. RSA 1365]|nr:hypothetical protein H4S08_003698 [Coemansia sp. RSA 1365]